MAGAAATAGLTRSPGRARMVGNRRGVATVEAGPEGHRMSAGELIRFCNNPVCERCDEHLRPREVLRKAGREACPSCHEELVVRPARPRPPPCLMPGRVPARRRA